MIEVLVPGDALPDAEVLLPQGQRIATFRHTLEKYLGQGFPAQLSHRFLRL
jgi:hypothetical protein